MLIGIKRWLIKQLQDNLMTIFLIIAILAIGIIIGSIVIKMLVYEQKNQIMLFLNSFFKAVYDSSYTNASIFKRSIIDNYKTIGLIWLFGIMPLGVIVIPAIVLLKGFTLGFTVGFLVSECGIEGFLFSLLGILPQSLFIIPGIITIASIGMSYSKGSIKNKHRIKQKRGEFLRGIIDYAIMVMLFSTMVLTGCLIEAYISPIFLKLIVDYL